MWARHVWNAPLVDYFHAALSSRSFSLVSSAISGGPRKRARNDARSPGCRRTWATRVLFAALTALTAAAAPLTRFHLPAGDAVKTLKTFSKESGIEIIYSIEQVRGTRTQTVDGDYAPGDALEAMLARTGLQAVQDSRSRAFVIRRVTAAPQSAGAPSPAAVGKPAAAENITAFEGTAGLAVVAMTPFEVRSECDVGYKAVNSITATRVAVPIRDLPMAISSFTESFIEDQKPRDLYDVVKWAPGVHEDDVSPQGWVRYNIRGFTSAAVQRNGFSSFRFIDTTDIERVEVVKGPASLLYGEINPGGVINYITKRPLPNPQVELTGAIGTGGYARIVVDTTGPMSISDGKILYRLIAMSENVQEFQDAAKGRKYLIAPSVTWKISDQSSLTLDYEHFERLDDMPTGGVILRYNNNIPGAPYGPLPWNFSYAGDGDYQNFVSDALTAEFDSQIAEHVHLRAAYLESNWGMDWRATGQGGTGLISQSAIDYYYPTSAGLTPADAMFRRNRWESQWGGERSAQVDVVGDYEWPGLKLQGLIGAKEIFSNRLHALQKNNPTDPSNPYYLKPWDLRDPSTWDRRVPFSANVLLPAVDTQTSSDASSAYAVVTASAFEDHLKILGGFARHELHNNPTYNHFDGTATPPSNRGASIPQIGALYNIGGGVSAFASYSESFLANTNMLRVNNVPTLPAAPSSGQGTEAGLKIDLFSDRVAGTVSVYRIRANPTDIVTITTGTAPDGTTLFTDVQGGSQRSTGTEFDLLLAPWDDLQFKAGFSRCHAVYEQHPVNPAYDGTPLVATPDVTFSFWGKYAPRRGRWSHFMLAGGMNYVGSMVYVSNNPFVRTAPYTTVDATIGYQFRAFKLPFEVELTVKNLFNAHYYESASTWGYPREGMMTVRTAF